MASTLELSTPPLHVVPGRWRGNLEVTMKMAPNDQSTPTISVSNNDSSHMAGIVHQKTFMVKLWSVSKFILSPVGKLIVWMFFVLFYMTECWQKWPSCIFFSSVDFFLLAFVLVRVQIDGTETGVTCFSWLCTYVRFATKAAGLVLIWKSNYHVFTQTGYCCKKQYSVVCHVAFLSGICQPLCLLVPFWTFLSFLAFHLPRGYWFSLP